MQIGLLSDTHGFLDEAVFQYFSDCQEIWHAGDFGTVDVLQKLRAFRPVRAVFGNVDGQDIRIDVPEELEWECEGVRIFMTHIGGPPARKQLIKRKPDVFVCGHSHILKVAREKEYLYMNPGACGHNGWHTIRTLLRLQIDSGKVHTVQAVELGPRGRSSAIR
jgi:putative phosphoesterase